MINFIKKKYYQHGPGSPGETSRSVANSFQIYRIKGYDNEAACSAVLSDYFSNFLKIGIDIDHNMKKIINEISKGEPILVTLSIVVISLNKKQQALIKLKEDINMIMDIILNEQRIIVYPYYFNRTNYSDLKEKIEAICDLGLNYNLY